MHLRNRVLVLLLGPQASASAWADIVVVNTTSDVSANNDGICTLREAIAAVNSLGPVINGCVHQSTPGPERIHFNIPGPGVHTIAPTLNMEVLGTEAVVVDGLTQPGASCDTWPPTLLIKLDGSQAGAVADGVGITGANSMVRGLVIGNFARTGILVGARRVQVQCNFLGTDETGTLAAPNQDGVFLGNNSSDAVIGTNGDGISDALEGNLISGHPNDAAVWISSTSRTIVAGNKIGTDIDGLDGIPNASVVFLGSEAADGRIGTNADGVADDLEVNRIAFNTLGISMNESRRTHAHADLHCNTELHANRHANLDSHCKQHLHGDRDVHTDANIHHNSDLHRDQHGNPDLYSDPDTDPHPIADPEPHVVSDEHAQPDTDGNQDLQPDADLDRHCLANAHRTRPVDANPHRDTNVDPHPRQHADGDRNPDRNHHTSQFHTDPHTAASRRCPCWPSRSRPAAGTDPAAGLGPPAAPYTSVTDPA